MNTVYHLPTRTYDEFKAKIDKMASEGDPALCCATVVWRPSGLSDYYETLGWEGQPLGKVFSNLGIQKASELFYSLTKNKQMSEKDAWLEVYSRECAIQTRKAV